MAKSIPVHSLILSSHLFFCQPFLLFSFTVPCRNVFSKPEDLKTWTNNLSFRFFTRVRRSSYCPMAIRNVQKPPEASHLKGLCSFSYSAVKIHDSQAYRNMEMTRERISFIFYPRDMLSSLQMGFSFVRAAMACAILERLWFWNHHLKQLLQGT